jgi:hypothetical protein
MLINLITVARHDRARLLARQVAEKFGVTVNLVLGIITGTKEKPDIEHNEKLDTLEFGQAVVEIPVREWRKIISIKAHSDSFITGGELTPRLWVVAQICWTVYKIFRWLLPVVIGATVAWLVLKILGY